MLAGACQMITMALEAMAVSCSGKLLEPGVCMTDHCDGERLGRKKHEDDDEEDGDDGMGDEQNEKNTKQVKDLCKDHPKFVEICMHLKCLHHCQSEEMR